MAQRILSEPHDLLDGASAPRAGLHGRIVGHHAHGAPVDAADPGDDTVGRQIGGHGIREETVLDERLRIEQKRQTIADEQLVLTGELVGLLVEVAPKGPRPDGVELAHALRFRTRNLSGTAPNPNASRSERSR